MEENTFENWYEANKESEILQSLYYSYSFDVEIMGVEEPVSFKEWMKEQYDNSYSI
jgi:hypothetical protein